MGLFNNKSEHRTLSIKKEMCCCQCHKKISECYVKPENEESYRDIFMVCPDCFIEFAQLLKEKGE